MRITNQYRTHVFDCDGVLLKSNQVKELAFYAAALAFTKDAHLAVQLVNYHVNAGATGRMDRVLHFFNVILGAEEVTADSSEAKSFYAAVSAEIKLGMLECKPMPGIDKYLADLRFLGCKLAVVSGIEQDELEAILRYHALFQWFPNVVGTNSKSTAIAQMIHDGEIERPAVLYGDTYDDAQAAIANGLDFVLVTGDQSSGNRIRAIRDFGEV